MAGQHEPAVIDAERTRIPGRSALAGTEERNHPADRETRSRRPRDSATTHARLLDAAQAEFNARGFEGTDTNRIARRAGYAPQSFYRHFADKTEIFLAVYARWWQDEADALDAAAKRRNGVIAAARVALAFHTRWRGFRRSLRHLAVADPAVRAARTAARTAQLARLRAFGGARKPEALVAALLGAERLLDAFAEGELADLGLTQAAARRAVAAALAALLPPDTVRTIRS